jgi:hypothetical protein
MKEGDLIIVTEPFPDWEWVEYTTGSIGIIINKRAEGYHYTVIDVYFFHSQKLRAIPSTYVKVLKDFTDK